MQIGNHCADFIISCTVSGGGKSECDCYEYCGTRGTCFYCDDGVCVNEDVRKDLLMLLTKKGVM